MREEVQARGWPQQGQRAAEGEGGREERGPERCPRETQEEAEALVTEPPLAVQEQPPQLQQLQDFLAPAGGLQILSPGAVLAPPPDRPLVGGSLT